MEDSDVAKLSNCSNNDAVKILQDFSQKHVQTFQFLELSKENKRKNLWEALFQCLQQRNEKDCLIACLGCLRILSRDKTGLNDVLQENWVCQLLRLCSLFPLEEAPSENSPETDYDVVHEAQKCLSNVLFQSQCAQAWCAAPQNWCLASLVRRLRDHPGLPQAVRLFDLKLLFLLTAVCEETRVRVRLEEKGLLRLVEAIEQLLPVLVDASPLTVILNEDGSSLACEMLKVMFNLVDRVREPPDEEEEAWLARLVPSLRLLLLSESARRDEICGHCVHLLMAIPATCYAGLVPALPSEMAQNGGAEGEIRYDTRALDVLLDLLDARLKDVSPGGEEGEPPGEQALERLCPLLTVLAGGALALRPLRKHVRARVLPPLKEVHKRPEEGNTLRSALCRLLMCPVTPVRDLAADLLFVLCKESVSRMVKHTGYGNCAGLLANRGLMLGGRGDRGHYSSESEDSDTEEYRAHREHINPVIGCCEPPRADPLANMSDEQKEFEAMQLVNMMDQLTRGGVVQPCRIGEDGRPEPLDHVMQLQDARQGPPSHPRDLSDSD